MRRGTTPTHTFTLPFDTSIVEKVRVIYTQGGVEKVIRKENEVQMAGDTITVKLTQAETLSFDCKLKAEIQVRVLTHSGDALASDIMVVTPDRCLSDEVL